MKTVWIYVHASIASTAWLFVLLTWCLSLLDLRSNLHQDPVFTVIAIFMTLGHLSIGSYLARRIREEILEAKLVARNASAAHQNPQNARPSS